MHLIVRGQEFEISNRRKLSHETFTNRYSLARLSENLETARRELETLPQSERRRQREKIKRLENKIDKAQVSLIYRDR